MPIRPIDMQVAIPKLSEVSRMSHLEQHKAGLQQDKTAVTADKNTNRESQTVMQSEKDARSSSDADAKKKGRNEYVNNRRKKEDTSKASDTSKPPKSEHKIDIRI